MKAVALACLVACGSERGVVDLHVDVPYALHATHESLREAQASPNRLRRGGVRAIVTPLFVLGAYAMPPADVRAAYEATYAELRASHVSAAAATWLAFEGADGFVDDLAALDAWMARGACLVGLVHDHTNALAGASQDPTPASRARGLTEAGKRVAARVIVRGGLLDVAHASDASFDDLAAIARASGAPLVDSHTGMRALRSTMRNLDDRRVRIVAETGGIVGISMHGGHIGKTPGEHPTLSDVADHVMQAIKVAGLEHVAIGSDFDGGIDPPIGSDGEATWPRLQNELARRGLAPHAIDAVLAGNARRVFAYAEVHGCVPGARSDGARSRAR